MHQNKYEDASTAEVATSSTEDIRKEITKFIEIMLTTKTQPRDGYRKLLEFTLLTLGGLLLHGNRF